MDNTVKIFEKLSEQQNVSWLQVRNTAHINSNNYRQFVLEIYNFVLLIKITEHE